MNKILLISFIFLFSFSLSFISASYDDCSIYGTCETISKTTITFNNVSGSVNNSVYWNGFSYWNMSQPFYDWLSGFLYNYNQTLAGSNLYVPYTGANQNVDLGNNNFSVNGTTLFVDASNQRVGIGTTSPTKTLDISNADYGEVKVTSTLASAYGGYLAYNNLAHGAIFGVGGSTYTTAPDKAFIYTYDKDLLLLTGTGKVGIGTITPNDKLQINQAKNSKTNPSIPGLIVRDTTAMGAGVGGGITFEGIYTGTSATYGAAITALKATATDGEYGFDLGFFTRANGGVMTEKVRINDDGNFGIGTTAPARKLHLHEESGAAIYQLFTNTDATNGVLIGLDINEDFRFHHYENKAIRFYTNNAEKMTILNSGNVGIGTTAPTAKLDVNGTANFTGDVKPTNSSFNFGSSTLRWLKGWFNHLDVLGNANITGNLNVTGNFSAKIPYGMYSDLTTQTILAVDTPQAINFSSVTDAYHVNLTGNTNFTFRQAGDYMVQLSIIAQSDVAGKRFQVWVQKTNISGQMADIPNSNTIYDFKGANVNTVIAVPFILDMNTTDTFRVMIAGDSTGIKLPYTTNTSYSPATPSIIMTINRVSDITPVDGN